MESTIAPAPAQAPILSVSDTMSAIANKTKIAADPAPVAAPDVRFVKDAPTMPLSQPGTGEAVVETAPVEAAPVAEPAGELSLDDGAITITAQRNADGTFKTKLDPSEKFDLVIKDPETGEPRNYSKTLPELARMAKDAIGMQKTVQAAKALEPEVAYYRENLPAWQQRQKTLQDRLDAQEALNRELLSADDEIVIQHRERYKAEMSPEKQLERRNEQDRVAAETSRERAKQDHLNKTAKSFMESRIAPSLTAAEAIVGKHAVTGAVIEFTQDLTVRGAIPPASWPEMERRINSPTGPFQTWLQAESAKRTTDTDTVKRAREAAEAAQRHAQTVVNETGRQMAPVGRAGADGAQPLPKPKNSREAIDRMINRPLPTTVSASG